VRAIYSRGLWLATVLATLVLLSLLVSVDFYPRDHVRSVATKAQIAAFLEGLENYRRDVGDFPSELHGLTALRNCYGEHGWNGPYLAGEVPVDFWGVPYRYSLVNGKPRIVTLGRVAGSDTFARFHRAVSDSICFGRFSRFVVGSEASPGYTVFLENARRAHACRQHVDVHCDVLSNRVRRLMDFMGAAHLGSQWAEGSGH